MAVGLPFSPTHVTAIAARGEELERLGEDRQDAPTLIRDELRALATDAAASGMLGDHGMPARFAGTSGDLTRAFREIAVRIEQRIDGPSLSELSDVHRQGWSQ